MSQRKKLEQGRAEFAYQCAESGKQLGGGPKQNTKGKLEDSKEAKEYKSYCKKIPMMIKANGLGATLAFMKSKKSKVAYQTIYTQILQWFQKQKQNININFLNLKENEENIDLVSKVISLNSPEYRATTIEVLAFMSWLRRFAEGLIEGGEE